MSKFDCKNAIGRCEAQCCHYVPMEKNIYRTLKPVRKIIKEIEDNGYILPITEDGHCPFLNEDFQCTIYDSRPNICRSYGSGIHPMLVCPYIEPNGKVRSKKNREKINKILTKEVDARISLQKGW